MSDTSKQRDRFDPLFSIDRFWLTDDVRPGRKRIPGGCQQLLNTAPNLSGGERVRRGFAAYSTVTAPTGMQILKTAPIQSPSQQDVHVWFASDSGQKVYINPWFQASTTAQTTNLLINEKLESFNPTDVDVTVNANTLVIANAATNGLVATSNYYQGWVMRVHGVAHQYAYVVTYVVAGGTATFTFREVINASGYNWLTTDTFDLYRNFHPNTGFAPTYNNNLTSPPCVNADNSIIRVSGGADSGAGNWGIHITPYKNQEFFPADGTNKYTYSGTYITERRLKTVDVMAPFGTFIANAMGMVVPTGAITALPDNCTYWVGVAPIYDGYQIGELTRYETVATHYSTANNANANYIASGASFAMAVNMYLPPDFDKRITGFAFYMAKDAGDTRTTGRVALYEFVFSTSIVKSGYSNNWAIAALTSGGVNYTLWKNTQQTIDGTTWAARGNTYIDDSGIVEIPTDTMYSYSDELVLGSYHLLSNCYVLSESFLDRQNVFINPIGGNAEINSGIVQPDLFSNEQGFYRLKCEPTIGTKINGMRSVGIGELLLIKDRGCLLGRLIPTDVGTQDIIWQILDYDAGSATLAQTAQAEDDWIYFSGYEDVYRYRNGRLERLIERADKNDWLSFYRETISKSAKESTTIAYLPEGIILLDINQTTAYQFAFYTQYAEYGWRQCKYKVSTGNSTIFFKWLSKLQNGTVLGVSTEGTPAVYQFSNPATGAYYYTDGGTAIPVAFDTGDLVTSGMEARNTIADRWQLNRVYTLPTTGTLDTQLYLDAETNAIPSPSGLDTTAKYLQIPYRSDVRRNANTHRLKYNTNASPETMNAGTDFQFSQLAFFGHTIPRPKEISVAAGSSIVTPGTGTILGKHEFLIVNPNTWESFTFDNPFPSTHVYSSLDGNASAPTWRMAIQTARTSTGTAIAQADILFQNITLTGFQARSPEANTLVKYAIPED